MAAPVEFVDFSRIYVTGSEMRLLRDICGKPLKIRTEDRTEEAERLADLGFIEMFMNKDNGRQGLFATETGRAYIEYADRSKRAKLLGIVRWLIPLLLAIAALALSIRANSLLGWSAGGSAGQSYQQRSTASTNAPTSTADPQTGTADSQAASTEPQTGTANPQSGSDEPSSGATGSQTAGTPQSQEQQPGTASAEGSEEAPESRD